MLQTNLTTIVVKQWCGEKIAAADDNRSRSLR
mgnify:CR=1 FL=1